VLFTVLSIAGDILFVLALAIMAGASRQAWRRIDASTAVPLITRNGVASLSAPKAIALTFIPALAFLVGAGLLAVSAKVRGNLDFSIIAFGLKASLSATFALLHLRLVGKVLQALGARGLLRS
jgi:hypothetical protein